MQTLKQYIEDNKQRFLDELFDYLRIPSISSLAEHKKDMYSAAEYLKTALINAGCDTATTIETAGNPVVFAEKIINPSLPTVMVYGHMDVMPVDPIELWHSDPFEPIIKDEKIYARGADDDKGQGFMHLKAFEYLVKTKQLTCNVKFMIEGEEEIGSPNLPKFCEDHKNMLQADIILVSDTGMIAQDIPSITTGLRGLSYWEIEVTGPNRDLHSGIFGGAVANPINVLTKLLAQITDDNGHITIPSFYDDVMEVSKQERAEMAKAPFDIEAYKNALNVNALKGESGYTPQEHTSIRPSFDINGIWGGYTGEGAKTVLPSKAFAKVSTRLVPNQDNKKIAQLFKTHFENIAPDYVKVKVTPLHGGQGYVCPIDTPAYLAADKAYTTTFGKKPIPVRSGGSIPIIADFERILGIKSVLMGFGLASDAVHSPNENYPLFNFYKGIETIPYFYKYFAEEMQQMK